MLQGGHTTDSKVYQLCAQNNDGLVGDSEDMFHTVTQSCGNLTLTTEDSDETGTVYACIPASVAEGECFDFVEAADWLSQHDGEQNSVLQVGLQSSNSEASDVFLVEIPTMDENSLLKAMRHIQEKAALFPGAVVLFQGKGMNQALRHRHPGFVLAATLLLMVGFGIHFGMMALGFGEYSPITHIMR